jgi:hypothetical protein
MFKDFIISAKTNWIAVYGAIFATLGFVLSVSNYLRDRAKVRIQYKEEWKMLGHHEHYKENTLYSEIRVINKGRRPIKIEKLGARVNNKQDWIIIFDPYWFNRTNRILTEENPSTSIYWEKKLFDQKNIYYFTVTDASGKNYRMWLHRWKYYFRIILEKTKNKEEK